MSGTIPADIDENLAQPAVLRKGMTLPVAFADGDAAAATLRKGATLPVEFRSADAVPALLARTVIDGTPGDDGQGFTNRGAWVSGNDYDPYDVLTDGGETFLCTTAITNSTTAPSADAPHFLKWAAKGTDGIVGVNGAGYLATSTTSLATAGSGSKAFTTQAGLAYTAGARIRATSAGTGEWMEGIVTAYSGTTLTVTMDLASGTGTHADWNINVAGQPGGTLAGDLVGSASVTAQTTITVSSLDIGAHGGMYRAEFELTNVGASTANIQLNFNGDTTATNYDHQLLLVSGSGTTSARANSDNIFSVTAGNNCSGDITIRLDNSGKARSIAWLTREQTTAFALEGTGHMYRIAANLVSVTIASSLANSLTGQLRIYRVHG